jgi:hypothetical protein
MPQLVRRPDIGEGEVLESSIGTIEMNGDHKYKSDKGEITAFV